MTPAPTQPAPLPGPAERPARSDPLRGRGLTRAEADHRRAVHGSNQLPQPAPPSLAARILAQLRDPLVLVLLAAMVVTAMLRDITDFLVIGLVITLNTTVGVIQELRADQAVAALRQLAAPAVRLIRDGLETTAPSADLVPDDLVRVEAGDVVPADLTLLEAAQLQANEAVLTGESVPVAKAFGDDLLAGTTITTGRGLAVVTRTGSASALGRIAALVAAQPRRGTPLQRRLAGLGRVLAVVAAGLSGLVALIGLLNGQPLAKMVLAAVSLTVAAVPESLPAVVTLALALGAHRMARQSAIVRRLPAVETLGSVTVLATDKTGTLTEGLMSVELLVAPDGSPTRLTGTGYDPHGTVDPAPDQQIHDLARALLLCNDAALTPPDDTDQQWQPIGDPMEAALITAAVRCGLDRDLTGRYPRLAELPFDGRRLRMSTLHQAPDGSYLTVCKGAPESLLTANGPVQLRSEDRDRIMANAARLATEGYRVLAVAERSSPTRPGTSTMESQLRLLGLVALVDPLRAGAAEAVDSFAAAGIRLMLITGDHPATASAVATRLGLSRPDQPVVLDQDPGHDPGTATVYARVRPEQKLAIIESLQAAGEIVAMTGDGVNDTPALHRADIGVAMGRSGTEAARQAADLVLADDNLVTVRTAVREGRRIYANIRRFLVYGLAGGLAEVLVMLAGPAVGLAVPLLPAQILWINMLTHGLPGVALGAEPAEPNLMSRPPRRPDEAILSGLGRRIAGTGALIAAVSTAAALTAHATGRPWQSVLFTVLGLAQLGLALALRARGTGTPNRGLEIAVAISVTLQLAALYLAPLRSLLGTEPLSLTELTACAVVATIPALITLLTTTSVRRRTETVHDSRPAARTTSGAVGPTGGQNHD